MSSSTSLLRTATNRWRRFLRAVRTVRREQGVPAAGREAVSLVVDMVLRPVNTRGHRRLDRRLGVDTLDRSAAGGAVTGGAYRDSTGYSPTPAHHFARLLRSLPVTVPANFAFVDIGCGKGLTLLLAAEHGFRPIIGVECDQRLVALARDNIRAFAAASSQHAGSIEVVSQDALDYEFPTGPTVVFMFNPFGEDTTRAVVKNMERSMEQSPRPFFVAYFNPVHARLLDESPLLRRLKSGTTRWALYETTLHL